MCRVETFDINTFVHYTKGGLFYPSPSRTDNSGGSRGTYLTFF